MPNDQLTHPDTAAPHTGTSRSAGPSGRAGQVAAWLTPRFGARQYLAYLLGCVGFSFGVCCFAWAGLGADHAWSSGTGP